MSTYVRHRFPRGLFSGVGVLFGILLGCGAVGPPLPPEKIGIEMKVRQQRAVKDTNQTIQKTVTPIGEDEPVLPPLQPVGIN